MGTIAVCCENHTEHTNTLCGRNAEFYYVKAGGTYSKHWAFKGLSPALDQHTSNPTITLSIHPSDTTPSVRLFCHITVCDEGILIQLLYFWTLSIVLFYLKYLST
jgi:hypothetical protein